VLQESDPSTFLAQGVPRISNSDDAHHLLNYSWGIFVLAIAAILAPPFAFAHHVCISRLELHTDPAEVVLEFLLGPWPINSFPNGKYDVKNYERITNRKPSKAATSHRDQ
jgi:hypothetical protein